MNNNTITFAAKFQDPASPRISELRRVGWTQHDVENMSKTVTDTKFHMGTIQYLYLRRLNPPKFYRGRISRPLTSYNSGQLFPVHMGTSGPFNLDLVSTFTGYETYERQTLTKDQYVSLIAMQSVLGMQETVKTEAKALDSAGRSHSLRIFGTFSENEVRDRYCKHVAERFDGYKLDPDRADFWWDVENHVFLTFDRNFSQTIPALLVGMLKTVNTL